MKRLLFITLFGLFPLWAAVAFVIFAFIKMPREHAAVTLWVFVVALPACAITLAITGATLAVHAKTAGEVGRKRKYAFAFFLVAVVGLAAFVQYLSLRQQDAEQMTLYEKRKAEEFVAKEPSVIAAVGEPVKASVASYSRSSGGSLPAEYDVSASGERGTVYAIVRPARDSGSTRFVLICTTHLSLGRREAHKDPCGQ